MEALSKLLMKVKEGHFRGFEIEGIGEEGTQVSQLLFVDNTNLFYFILFLRIL